MKTYGIQEEGALNDPKNSSPLPQNTNPHASRLNRDSTPSSSEITRRTRNFRR